MSQVAYKSWLSGIILNAPGNDSFPLQRGSKGQRVTRIQMLLNRAGAGLKEDGDFGAKTETALKTYYGVTSVADQAAFDKLYKQEAAKNYKPKTETQTITVNDKKVEIPKTTKEEFDAMLKVDYATFGNLAQLGATLQTMQNRILAHGAEKKKQEAALGPYSYAAATTGNWKGKPYGLFSSVNEADAYMQRWKKGVATYERVKKAYEKRQAEYRNSPTLKAAKAISEVKDKLVSNAKNLYSKFKKWALSGTEEVELGDGGLISGPVLIVAGIAITTIALAVMAGFVTSYAKGTALDAEDVETARKENEKLIKSEEKDRDELYKKAEERKAAGDAAGAKQFADAALKKEESISQLKKKNVEVLSAQQDIEKIKAENDEGSIFKQIGDNAGKIVIAGAGLLLVGLAWQNRDTIKEKVSKRKPELQQAA